MEKNDIWTMKIIDMPNACNHCAFCHSMFRSDDKICLLRDACREYLDPMPSIYIPDIHAWTCNLFIDYDMLCECKKIKSIEEFNVLCDLGKFNTMHNLIVGMIHNFFISDNTASNKQLSYEATIARSLRKLPPMMIDLDTFDCGNLDIRLADNKQIVWKWTNENVDEFKGHSC